MSEETQLDYRAIQVFLKHKGFDIRRSIAVKNRFAPVTPQNVHEVLVQALWHFLATELGIHWPLLWRDILLSNASPEPCWKEDIEKAIKWHEMLSKMETE